MKIKVYSGLSLTEEQVTKFLPEATFAKPIVRGDLLKDIKEGFQVVAIVDGEFNQSLAISANDIMDALRCGLRIYGSSSMGALRAAELEDFGMIGCGEVFEFIKNNKYFKDDHLGHVYFEGPQGLVQGLPMVDLQMALSHLVQRKEMSQKQARVIQKHFERLHFSHRSLPALTGELKKRGLDTSLLSAISRFLLKEGGVKRLDALSLLKRIKTDMREIRVINRSL